MDEALFRSVNNLAGQWQALDALGVFAATGLIWVMLVGLLILFAFRPNLREQVHLFATVVIAGLASVCAYVFNYLVSVAYFRVRPFAALDGVTQLIAKEATDKGFPSDHTALAFAIAIAVFLAHRKWGIVFIVAAALVALGRVFVGVHYPLDILAGAIVGGGFAVLVCHFGRGMIESFLKKK